MINLQRQGYSVYLPKLKVKKRQRDCYRVIIEPMFSRYLFVSLSTSLDPWEPICSTRGVAKLVRFGLQPASVPEQFINMLKCHVQTVNEETEDQPLFLSGELVLVHEGPFAGYEAVFKADKSEDRAIVMLNIVNTHMQLTIAKSALDKVH